MTTTEDLASLLSKINRLFGIEKVLSDRGKDLVDIYYAQSGPAYERLHSPRGAMHLAIMTKGTEFKPDGYRTQPRRVVGAARHVGAKKILELGCGKGFNVSIVARNLPEVAVIGTDLLPDHVEAARAGAARDCLANLTFEIASFEALPEDLSGVGVAFAVETLCYARDLHKVATGVARSLAPGGRFLIYDVHTMTPAESWSADMAKAVRLYEISMAVTEGFHAAGAWEAALQRAGLEVRRVIDHSAEVLPGLGHLQQVGLGVVDDWKKRTALKAAPRFLARNLISSLLGPLVYAVPQAGREGPLAYQLIVAEKPGRQGAPKPG